MGECGCTANDNRYYFPGPNHSFYLLTLSGGCIECDGPPGISIEQFKPGDHGYDYYQEDNYTEGALPFEKWPDSMGIGIITGMLRNDFIDAVKSHLIGVDSKEMGEDGTIDEIGAETIIEEMYVDSITCPRLV